jgi:hypothetical protein
LLPLCGHVCSIDIIGLSVIADAVTGISWLPGDRLFISLFVLILVAGFSLLVYLLLVSGVDYFLHVVPDESEGHQLSKRKSRHGRSR